MKLTAKYVEHQTHPIITGSLDPQVRIELLKEKLQYTATQKTKLQDVIE